MTKTGMLATSVVCLNLAAAAATPDSPYAVCAHVAKGIEHDAMPANLELMQKAGIKWVRCDFSAWDVEGPRGEWHFGHIDKLLEMCAKYDLTVLPILNHPHSYASPPHEKTAEWLIYVEKLVTRYKDRIRHWEVLNEQNLNSEKEKGIHYAKVLNATYAKIKEIDPGLTVLYTGTAHIPLDFIEDSFKGGDGCASSFDIMNVHPYRRGFTGMIELRKFEEEVVNLRKLMAKYGVGDKPIWATEMGWPTPAEPYCVSRGILAAAKQVLAPGAKRWKAALLVDHNYPAAQAASFEAFRSICPPDFDAEPIKLTDLAALDPAKYNALALPPSENFPSPFHADIERYVAAGGTLFLLGGVPMYYATNFADEKADLAQNKLRPQPLIWGKAFPGSHDHTRNLRVDWRASWADPDKKAPDSAAVVLAEGTKTLMQKYADEDTLPKRVNRFLGSRFLKEGDRMVPLLMAEEGDYCAPCVAVYDLNSDMKGAVVVSTLSIEHDANTIDDQARYLPQAILLSQRIGFEKFFWYEFQDSNDDTLNARRERECYFGIVDRAMNPKPGYHAYAELIKACPAGSVIDTSLPWDRGTFAQISWTRPDGVKGWALWSPDGPRTVTLDIKGKVKSATDHLGKPLPKSFKTLTLSGGPIYLLGPENVTVRE